MTLELKIMDFKENTNNKLDNTSINSKTINNNINNKLDNTSINSKIINNNIINKSNFMFNLVYTILILSIFLAYYLYSN